METEQDRLDRARFADEVVVAVAAPVEAPAAVADAWADPVRPDRPDTVSAPVAGTRCPTRPDSRATP